MSKKRVKLKMFFNDVHVFLSVQVERLEVINKQYVRVILVPGANADAVRRTETASLIYQDKNCKNKYRK